MAGAQFDQNQDESNVITGINITPFVDVVLVLLVIFMITAPVLMKDIIEVKLPKTTSGDGQVIQTLGVAINKDGNILLNGQITDDAGLVLAVQSAISKSTEAQAVISADVDVRYGRVVKVIDLLKSNGLQKFAVQVEHEDNK